MAHRWNIPFIRIFLILVLLWACQPVGPTNPFDPKSPETVQALAGIRGEVVSVETGQPISEALVKVYELSEEASNVCGVASDDTEGDASSDDASSVAESTTNELGRFQIPGLSKGTYTLCVSHAQFAPLRRSGIRLAIGQKLTLSEPLALMVGTGTVSAQIELDNLEIDSALGQAVLRAVSVLLTPINSESSGSMVGRPDEFGRLTFVKVPLGQWRIRFDHPNYRTVVEEIELREIGEEVAVRGLLPIPLEINPGTIAGRVVLPDAIADDFEGLNFVLFDEDGNLSESTLTLNRDILSEDVGVFELSGPALGAGNYTLKITDDTRRYGSVEITPIAIRPGLVTRIGDVSFKLATGDLSVVVGFADENDLGDRLASLHAQTQLRLTSTGTRPAPEFRGESDENGRTIFRNVPLGNWTLRIDHPDYMSSTVSLSLTEPDQVLEYQALEPVMLSIDPGRVSGTLFLQESIPTDYENVSVLMMNDQGLTVDVETQINLDASSEDFGAFSVSSPQLRAGRYTLQFAHGDRLYETRTIGPIDVASGGNTLIGDVRLDYATGGLSGLVTTEDGAPSEGGVVVLSGSSSPQSQFLDADGQFSFGNMRVGTYSLSIRLDDYVALSFTEVTVNPNVVTTLSDMALAIDPGGIAGRVLDETGNGLESVTISDDSGRTFTTDVDGHFEVTELKAGVYSLTATREGFERSVLPSQTVSAGLTTLLQEAWVLPFSRGHLDGQISLEGDGAPVVATVEATSNSNGEVFVTVAGIDGRWQINELREGQYALRIIAPGYREVSTPATVLPDETTTITAELEIDRSCLRAQVNLSDGALSLEDVSLTVVETGLALNAPDEQGDSQTPELVPGTFTVRASLDGYLSAEQTVSLAPGIDCDDENIEAFDFLLTDLRGPAPFDVSLMKPMPVQLQGFDDDVFFIQPARFSLDVENELVFDPTGTMLGFTVLLSPSNAAESPFLDLNFDPFSAQGYIEMTGGQEVVYARLDSAVADFNFADCFAETEPNQKTAGMEPCVRMHQSENAPGTVKLDIIMYTEDGKNSRAIADFGLNRAFTMNFTAVDSEENESATASISLNIDTRAPKPTDENRLPVGVDGASCEMVSGVDFPVCHTADETIQLRSLVSIDDEPNFGNFACTYLFGGNISSETDLTLWTHDEINRCLVYDAGIQPQDCPENMLLNTDVCLDAGQISSSVTLSTGLNVYCLRGVDRSGRMSNSGCVFVVQDQVAPVQFDALPTGVDVVGRSATIYLTDLDGGLTDDFPTSLDAEGNFSTFLVQNLAFDPKLEPALCEDSGCSKLTVQLAQGMTNPILIYALDEAGNLSEPVRIELYEQSNEGLLSDDGVIGESPTTFGSLVAWADRGECTLLGEDGGLYGRGCSRPVILLDDSMEQLVERNVPIVPTLSPSYLDTNLGDYREDWHNLTAPNTCVVACPETSSDLSGGATSPHLVLGPNGIYTSHYHEGKDPGPAAPDAFVKHQHRLYYRDFGADKKPDLNGRIDDCLMRIDDGAPDHPIVDLQANEQLLAYIREGKDQNYNLYFRRHPPLSRSGTDAVTDTVCDSSRDDRWYTVSVGGEVPLKLGIYEDFLYLLSSVETEGSQPQYRLTTYWPNESGIVSSKIHDLGSIGGQQGEVLGATFGRTHIHLLMSYVNLQAGTRRDVFHAIKHENAQYVPASRSFTDSCEEMQCDLDEVCIEGGGEPDIDGDGGAPVTSAGICADYGDEGRIVRYDLDAAENPPCGQSHEFVELPDNPDATQWSGHCAKACTDDSDCSSGFRCYVSTIDRLYASDLPETSGAQCLSTSQGITLQSATSRSSSSCDWCGDIVELISEGSTIAWVVQQGDKDAERFVLVTAQVPEKDNPIFLPRVLVSVTGGRLHSLQIQGDRISFLDESSGASRVRQASIYTQNWASIGVSERRNKVNLKANDQAMFYFSEGTESGLFLGALQKDGEAINPLTGCTEGGQRCDLAPITLDEALFRDCEISPAYLQTHWRRGHGYEVADKQLALLPKLRGALCQQPYALFMGSLSGIDDEGEDVPLISSWRQLPMASTPISWEALVDVTDPQLRAALTDESDIIYHLTAPERALQPNQPPCTGAQANINWSGYGLKVLHSLASAETPPDLFALPQREVTVDTQPEVFPPSISCHALDAAYNELNDETHVVCAGFPVGCSAEVNDIAAKQEQRIVYFRYRTPGNQFDLIERVELSRVINPEKTSTAVADCDDQDPVDLAGLDFSRCGALKALRLGVINDVVINADGDIALELVDDEIKSIVILRKGADGIWGYDQKFRTVLQNDDEVALVYQRFGEDLGPLTMNSNHLVFADEGLAGQAELIQISINSGSVERLTRQDQRQSYPSLTQSGLYFIDERYAETGQGRPIVYPGITRRRLVSNCDAKENQCPSAFSCVGTLFDSECMLTAPAIDEGCAGPGTGGCPRGFACVEINQKFCLESSLAAPCRVCQAE